MRLPILPILPTLPILPILLTALSLSLLTALPGCDDEATGDALSDTAPDAVSDTAPDALSDTAPDTISDTSAPDTPETSTPETTTDAAETADTTEPAKVEAACDEAGYSECFSNDDCQASERCQNMSANDVEVPCCITGARGTKGAGEACTGENECETSLCISYNDGPQLCSKPCDGSASDCPAAASDCVFGLCVPGN